MGDLPGLEAMSRVMDAKSREKYRKIRDKKQQRLATPKIYYVKKDKSISGTKLLRESATYPTRFCNDLAKLYAEARNAAERD